MVIGAAGPNAAAGYASGTVNGTTYRAGGAVGAGGSAVEATGQTTDGTHTGQAASYNANDDVAHSANWTYNASSGGSLDVNGQAYSLPARPSF